MSSEHLVVISEQVVHRSSAPVEDRKETEERREKTEDNFEREAKTERKGKTTSPVLDPLPKEMTTKNDNNNIHTAH